MWNSTGRGRLYRTLAAEAIAKEKGEQMVDFKALAEKRKKEMGERRKSLTPLPLPEKIKEKVLSAREQTLQNLNDLIDHPDTSNWEKNFCNSVHNWLSRKNTNYMSEKQKAVYEKLLKTVLSRADTTSPVPTVDNRMRDNEYRAPYDNRNSAKRESYGFDDMDDDIPF